MTKVSPSALKGAVSIFALLTATPALAGALPTSGQYVAGSGTIAKAGKGGLTINQSSGSGIIDWNSFSIGSKNHVVFDNGSGATLNRVTGGNLSTIAGSLHATGSVYLINAQGVIVTGKGRVLTGGSFVGSTRDMSDSDFLNGHRHFTGRSDGKVSNAGAIVSANGDVALIGSSASNRGTLSAANGSASVNAGNDVLLAPAGSGGHVLVRGGRGDAGNSGSIEAAQAQINAAGGNIYALSGNNGGLIRANGTRTIDGHVWLTSNTGNVSTTGAIRSSNASGAGGEIDARGSNITASGVIDTSARGNGRNGGTVSIVSSNSTTVIGTIRSQGGAHGKGGFIETSGEHLHVADSARISTLAPLGHAGMWLIDPEDFTVAASGGDITGTALTNELKTTDVAIQSSSGSHNPSGNGDIFINDAVTSAGRTLTLEAFHDVDINALVTIAGGEGGLVVTTGVGGDLHFANGGHVVYTGFANGQDAFSLNGTDYKIENSLPALAAALYNDGSANYALANNYNAAGDNGGSPYAHSAITTTLSTSFEGLGNTISNLSITTTSSSFFDGLFSNISSGGVVRDIALTGLKIKMGDQSTAGGIAASNAGSIINASVGGTIYGGALSSALGGLVGTNSGTITNSHSSASVTIGDASVEEDNTSMVGGLVGNNSGNVSGSDATGAVRDKTATYLTDSIGSGSTDAQLGGLIGQNSGQVTSSYATGSVTGSATGNDYVGGLIGVNASGGNVLYSYATGAVTSASGKAGGFVGQNNSTISYSYATGAASSLYAGGFVSDNGGAISKSYATGAVSGNEVGGFVASNESGGTIAQSYSLGAVSGTSSDTGGFVGDDLSTGGITASFWDEGTSGIADGTKGAGNTASDSGITGEGDIEMRTASTYAGWTFGTDSGSADWVIVDSNGSLNNASGTAGGTTPVLLIEHSTTITNAHQLELMATDLTAHYTLAGNISAALTGGHDIWTSSGFIPVGGNAASAFSGDFNGAGHTISGLFINDPSNADIGLFGKNAGAVENVGLVGDVITSEAAGVTGALIGENSGTVSSSYSTGVILGLGLGASSGGLVGFNDPSGTISQSYTSGGVTSEDNAGGLVGYNRGLVTNSYSNANVSSGVTGTDVWVGGLAGANLGTIKASYAMGSVRAGDTDFAGALVGGLNGGDIESSYAVGYVSGTSGAHLGGLVGHDSSATTFVSDYWDTQTTGRTAAQAFGDSANVSGVTGKTTAQLQTSLPSGFSASDWAILPGVSFPYLKWQFSSGTPEVVSGLISGTSANKGVKVDVLVDGVAVVPAASMSSGANGYYYELLSPGTISSSGHAVLAYLESGSPVANRVQQHATGSLTGFNLVANKLSIDSTAGNETGVVALLKEALGSHSGSRFLFTSAGVFKAGIDLAMNLTASAFSIDKSINVGSGIIDFTAAGSIGEKGTVNVVASTLTGSAAGGVSLKSATNSIEDLGAFHTIGNKDFTITDSRGLTVDAAVSTGTGDLTLTTTGASHGLDIHGTLHGGTVVLNSAGTISASSAGKITATTLRGSSHGAAILNASNDVTNLGAFTTGGNNAFGFTDARDLAVVGGIGAGSGGISLTTLGNGDDLILHGVLHGGTIKLNSAGSISANSAGKITAATLTGSSHGATSLGAANTITNLGTFNTNNGNFALMDAVSLTTTGAVQAGTGTLALKTTGSGHSIAVHSHLSTTGNGGVVSLTSAGNVTETSAGAVITHKLNVKAQTGITLTSSANNITTLGTHSTASGPNNIHL